MNGKQLKNSILQWAIQGKLVPQDPNDEPASELLKRIREEKARLVKEGKIKKDKNESIIFRGGDNSHYEKLANGEVRCIDNELPFEIPNGWLWCRIKNVFSMQAGKFVSANDIQDEQTGEYFYPCYGGNGLRGYVKKYNNDGDFTLVGRQGALCGNVQIVSGKFYATEHAVVTDGYGQTNVKWAFYFLTALNLNQYATATAQPGLAVSNILEVLLPLPPLSEQHRIVEKLEGLLPLIEQYDVAQSQLDTLNDELKGLLKKSILQEAIRGKLVPQCDTDEPASMLLEHIKDEKRKLVRAGKLKAKDIVDSVIFKGEDNKYYEQIGNNCIEISDEIPFSIPEKWKWCRLKQVCSISMGQSPDGESVNGTTGVEFHQGKIQFGEIYLNDSDTYTNKPTKIAEANSLLLCVRAPVGILNITKRQICIGRGLCSINPYYNSNILLWFYFLSTYRDYFEKKATGSTFKAISNEIISNTLIPLPPMGEQQRIVERIQELYSKL